MKQGGMQANVPASCFNECGRRFLRPMIELVAPKVVVTLGRSAMRATCRAFAITSPQSLTSAVAKAIPLFADTMLMPLYHPSPTVLNTTRALEVQHTDWRAVARLLQSSVIAA
jgi:uracil-DNA glycosylase